MSKTRNSLIVTVGLAIFSMLFGAGNLMYPLKVGISSGSKNFWGMSGFVISAILLPLAGLIGMILFDGNYHAYFKRLGKTVGEFILFVAILIVGPVIAIPRIVTLSHTMTSPFLPFAFLREINIASSFAFSLLFLGITFLASYRENRIVDILGYVISPLLLISLSVILVKGIITGSYVADIATPAGAVFKTNFIRGYETLDLLAAIFFSSIVLHILKNTIGGQVGVTRNKLALIGFKAGMLGVFLLALIYIGMSILGVYHGHEFATVNEGELFRGISFTVLGTHGAMIIATAVLMACFSTSIALAAVTGEYFQLHLFKQRISYVQALLISLTASIPLSTMGLDQVRALTGGPSVYILYPVIITLTFCNILYKLVGFSWVKLPVFIVFLISLISYYW